MKTLAETTFDTGFSIRFAHDRIQKFDALREGSRIATELVEDRGKIFLRKVRLQDDLEIEKMKLPHNSAFSKDGVEWQPIWNN